MTFTLVATVCKLHTLASSMPLTDIFHKNMHFCLSGTCWLACYCHGASLGLSPPFHDTLGASLIIVHATPKEGIASKISPL